MFLRCADALVGDYFDVVVFLLMACVQILAFSFSLVPAFIVERIKDEPTRMKVGIASASVFAVLTIVYFAMAPVDYLSHLGWRPEAGLTKTLFTGDYQGTESMSQMPALIFPNIHISGAIDNWFWRERMDVKADIDAAQAEGDIVGGLCLAAGFITSLPAMFVKYACYGIYSLCMRIYWWFNPWLIGMAGVLIALYVGRPGQRYSSSHTWDD